MFPCPYSHLRISSRETTGSVVPSRVNLLILYTQAEFGAYSRDSSSFPRRRPFIYTANHHRVSLELIRWRNCVPMAFTAESPPVQGQSTYYVLVFKYWYNIHYMYVCMVTHHIIYMMDQPGKVANPARGQLNKEN